MTASTDFIPFATGTGANVESQAAWVSDATVGSGFSAGIAPSAKFNKAWRQGTFIAAGVANWLANTLGINVADDGNLSGLVTNLTTAIAPLASPAFTGTPTAPTATAGTNTTQVATTAYVYATSGAAKVWVDETASRVLGTTYTNSTAYPIDVSINVNYTAGGSNIWTLTVGGVLVGNNSGNSSTNTTGSLYAKVMPGQTYVATATTGSVTLYKWAELR